MTETRKVVTVVFADVSGSTALGERLDPEALRRVMERYFAESRTVLERHGGTVEKFIGDAVVGVFGIPAAHEDDALRAVRAAAELRGAMKRLNEELERERGVRLAVRTGVNTGEVVAGDPSGGQFYATGDAVNLAARLEQAAEPGEILLGEQTYRLVRDAVRVEAQEPLGLKGKTEAVFAHRLVEVIEGAPAVARRFDTPFVGRREELALLLECFERSVAERAPALVTVLGPAGIGKTRLATELIARVAGQATVLQGRCLSYGEGITFWPLQEILSSLRERPPDIPDPSQAKSTEETFWAYRKLFAALAQERALVLILEDIHWAEATLLDLVEHIVEWTRDAPLMILCLARPELLDERPGWPGVRVELERLPQEEAMRLVSALAIGGLDAGVAARTAEAAEGNPLFLEQMLAFAAEGNGGEVTVPQTIQALLAARLDRLEPEERALLEAAAVVGKEFWRGALLHLSPPDAEVSALLQRLMRRRLVRPEGSSLPGEDAFRFGHILIREAAYAGISKDVRADLHERFADWLERSGRPYAEIIGYQLEQAYRYRAELGPVGDGGRKLASRAGTILAEAGLEVLHRGDVTGAANLVSRGLDLLPADAPRRGELLLALGDCLSAVGDWRDASAVYDQALAAAGAAGDRGLAWEVTLGRNWLEVGVSPEKRSNDEYLREAEEAAAELEELAHARGLARAWHAIAMMRLWSGQGAAGADAAERAAAFAHRAGDWRLERESLGALGLSLYTGPTPATEGIRRCEEILVRIDEVDLRSRLRRVLCSFHAMLGHSEEARRLHELALADAEELGLKPRIAAIEMLFLALAETLEPSETERKLRHSLALLEEMGEEATISTPAAKLARTLNAQGRYDEAERYAAVAESAASPDDYGPRSLVRAARARIVAERGDLEGAESLAREAVEIADRSDDIDLRAWLRLDLADVLILAEKAGEARSVLADAVRLAEEKEELILVKRARARLGALS